jgi:hypothetical protein
MKWIHDSHTYHQESVTSGFRDVRGMKRKNCSQQTYHDSEPTVAYLQCVETHNTEYPRSHAGNCEPIGAIARKVPRADEHDTADI